MHDIGKIGVPDAVINKPDRLSDEEFDMVKKHPVMGANILEKVKEDPNPPKCCIYPKKHGKCTKMSRNCKENVTFIAFLCRGSMV